MYFIHVYNDNDDDAGDKFINEQKIETRIKPWDTLTAAAAWMNETVQARIYIYASSASFFAQFLWATEKNNNDMILI